jgi:hypothetical protein
MERLLLGNGFNRSPFVWPLSMGATFNRPSGETSSPSVLHHLQLSTYLDTTTEVTALLPLLVEVEMLVDKGGEWWLLLQEGGECSFSYYL